MWKLNFCFSAFFSNIANISNSIEHEEMVAESITTKVQKEATLTEESEIIATSEICFNNFGKLIKKPKLFSALENIKNKKLPEIVPDGNKSNLTFFVKKPNTTHGPGALTDDKAPFSERYGGNCYAYEVKGESFRKAHPGYISTSGSMTYKENGVVHPVKDEWIILWTNYAIRSNDKLKRDVTYIITNNPELLWMNQIALVEYTGIDSDEFSSKRPHGNRIQLGEPHIRQRKDLIDHATEMRCMGVPARKVFKQFKNVAQPSLGISSPKKIYDAYSKHKQKDFGPSFGASGSDQMVSIFRSMQLGKDHKYGSFVRNFSVDQNGKPGFICYEDWQINYTKRCCAFNPIQCSPIHEDKTYNTSVSFLTLYCFLSFDFVLADDPSVHPIIPGKFSYYSS